VYINEKYHEKAGKFLQFTLAEEGEKIVLELGFVPVK
jgi:ABC-type phosphate transport system substrate-binding protein